MTPTPELKRLAEALGGTQDWRLITTTDDAKRIGPYVVRHAVGAVAAVPKESPITSDALSYMAYIAAANPARVLHLIEENERLREALEPFAAIEPMHVFQQDGEDGEGKIVLTENQFTFARQALGGQSHE